MHRDAAMAEQIIGRRTELQALARFIEAVPAGGRALLMEGDAGIGKTALLHDAVRTARARSLRVDWPDLAKPILEGKG